MPAFRRPRPRALAPIAATATVLVLAGCTTQAGGHALTDGARTPSATPTDPAGVTVNASGDDVAVDTLVKVTATAATLSEVTVSHAGESEDDSDNSSSSSSSSDDTVTVPGELAADKASWTATSRLDPGETYTVHVTGTGTNGAPVDERRTFTTTELSRSEQVYPSIAPLTSSPVGVAQPITVLFDVPVKDHRAAEKAMKVTASSGQEGAWHWYSDTEARYRAKEYWKPGTTLRLDAELNGVKLGDDLYGQRSRSQEWKVADPGRVIKVDLRGHRMTVEDNGRTVKTFPISAGKSGFLTRSGTKVISEKLPSTRMASETVAIGGSEAYDLQVRWAMRLTNSGEFIHAAPWNNGNMGEENSSHGCTGMRTADAKWLFESTPLGTPVEYTNGAQGTKEMAPSNGYGDWNLSWDEWQDS